MTIRGRIFVTYIVLIFIVLVYLAVTTFTQTVRVQVETDLNALLQLRNSWSTTHIAMTNIVINWENGRSYRRFLRNRAAFNEQLQQIALWRQSRRWYPDTLTERITNLQNVWSSADLHMERVINVVQHNEFAEVESRVEQMPGLQRFNHLWIALLNENSIESRRQAFLIQQLIEAVEFFPIYSQTVEGVFELLLNELRDVQISVIIAERVFRVIFFIAFIVTWLFTSSRFALSISRPIRDVAYRLRAFIGQTGTELSQDSEHNEVLSLSETTDHIIRHYTDLADRAQLLARGEIDSDETHFSREGIVSESLDEIAGYMRELAQASRWIQEGEYGQRIRERSSRDVITHNFNVMSSVIRDKIITLQNMFDAVDESVLVVDERKHVVEANTHLTALLGGDDYKKLLEQLDDLIQRAIDGEEVATAFIPLHGYKRRIIPLRIETRVLEKSQTSSFRVMFLISNESWRARSQRERERLRAQANLAELKALRSQINPHFLFNTLNTIAYLIETKPDDAIRTVETLAHMFRYTLEATDTDIALLKKELQQIEMYLHIEKLRFTERLHVDFNIEEHVRDSKIPTMLLQPLVENAVHYGADEKGVIRVSIRGFEDDGFLRIRIADQGAKEVAVETLFSQPGTGIRNVDQRLRTLFGEPLQFFRNQPRGVVAEVRIPMLYDI